jgi:energy-coupling factor transporter ATP-binding protein EcfA2
MEQVPLAEDAAVRAITQAAASVVEVVRRAPAPGGACRVVAIDGRSGSGKSTFADTLARLLGKPGPAVPVVRMDALYPGWDGLEAGVDRLVSGILTPLALGRAGRLQRYDWVHRRDGPVVEVPAAPLLVVEGCGSGARRCAPSLLVWLAAPEAARYERAMARDGDTFRRYWQRWADQEATHYARERTSARADAIIDGLTWKPARG